MIKMCPTWSSMSTQHASGWTGGMDRYSTSSKQVRRPNGWNSQVEALLQLGSQTMHSTLPATCELSDYIDNHFKSKSDWVLPFRGALYVPLNPAHAKTTENLPLPPTSASESTSKMPSEPKTRTTSSSKSIEKPTRRNAATCAAVGSIAELLYLLY